MAFFLLERWCVDLIKVILDLPKRLGQILLTYLNPPVAGEEGGRILRQTGGLG
jgi:hypothetical protein